MDPGPQIFAVEVADPYYFGMRLTVRRCVVPLVLGTGVALLGFATNRTLLSVLGMTVGMIAGLFAYLRAIAGSGRYAARSVAIHEHALVVTRRSEVETIAWRDIGSAEITDSIVQGVNVKFLVAHTAHGDVIARVFLRPEVLASLAGYLGERAAPFRDG